MEEKMHEPEINQQNNSSKPRKNKFVIKYIIFVIFLMIVTALGIYFTIKHIDESTIDTPIAEEPEVEPEENIVEEKKLAEDSIYAINSYDETYDTNSLNLVVDGVYQIDGLKDLNIQNKINIKLKEEAFKQQEGTEVYSYVSGNFSNILSIVMDKYTTSTYEHQIKTLNIDLTTGEEIPFEKLFVSSAPIKSIIASGMYEDFAWKKFEELRENNSNIDEPIWDLDMKDIDTSEIEDEIFLALSKYNELKDEIIYSISPSTITIYNSELKASINMVDYLNEIAIYKRYLTEESIFEDDTIGTKGVIVFTKDCESQYSNIVQNISYGKIADNIFIEEVLFSYFVDEVSDDELNIIQNYVKELSKEQQTKLKQETPKDKGVIFQREYDAHKDDKYEYYHIYHNSSKAEYSISYFEEQAFKDYIEVNARDRASVGLNRFNTFDQQEYPDMQISIESEAYYISLTGEFLGSTEEEAISNLR